MAIDLKLDELYDIAISFYSNAWRHTWIIWPVAGVLFAVLCCVIRAVMSERK